MKKTLLLAMLLGLVLILLSGCAAPEDADPDPSPSDEPSEAPPTYVAPTPYPTITPYPMEGVEWPEDGATLLMIDPVDKPTRPPIDFKPYVDDESSEVGVKFQRPSYWEKLPFNMEEKILVIQEPANDIKSGTGIPSQVIISMEEFSTVQTEKDAQNALNSYLDRFRQLHDSLTTSSIDNNRMMNEMGKYVTFWIDQPYINEEGVEDTMKMRGRILIVPKDRRLYMLQYLCPANWNSDYVNVYYTFRSSMEEL